VGETKRLVVIDAILIAALTLARVREKAPMLEAPVVGVCIRFTLRENANHNAPLVVEIKKRRTVLQYKLICIDLRTVRLLHYRPCNFCELVSELVA
jgi:hypothetical protein